MMNTLQQTPRSTGTLAAAPLLLNSTEAARSLAISERTLARLVAAGEIPAIHIGRSVRFSSQTLAEWIALRESAAVQGHSVVHTETEFQ